MKKINGIVKVLLISLLLCGTTFCSHKADTGYIVKIGQIAPDFILATTEGKLFKLSENRGKVIMLQFTASWCGVCRKEMPHIESEIWQPLKGKDFVLVGIDRDEPMNIASGFAKKMNITYPLAPDLKASVFSLYAKKEAGVTRNVIIDKDGKIVFLTRLYDEKEFIAMKGIIDRLVEKR
jgi:peroxiredoxin